uniref:D-inositol-3-phosphate glycosyltransferase n=1 Tax=Candidatus Methanogaster sp. ANME-2c ERB4 TaxID=2759911 RepID=A0A7G9YE72_9EURY|nr:D-inositol-3-phosphate glycosyltransferase [Methanosarcinales archaeon ANME-2c ERB4]
MKILLVSEYFYPRLAGGELSLWKLCTGLTNRGYKIAVITSKMENTKKHEFVNGIEIYRPLSSGDSILKRIWFLVRLYPYLKTFIRDKEIDVIYNLGYVPTLPTTFIASKYNIPVITAIASLPGKLWFKLTNPVLAFFNCFMEMFIIRFGKHDILRFPAKYTKKMASPYIKSKNVIIYDPINVDEIKEIKLCTDTKKIIKSVGIEEDELFLLFVGLLAPVKNVVALISTLSKLNRKFKLVLVGEGSERRKIERLTKKLDLERKVTLLGQKPHDETLSIIYSCDVLILPSKSEQFPNVVLEGLALGKPVISTKVGGVSEIKSENLYLVDDLGDINQILEKGIKPKEDDRVLKNYSMDKIMDEFEMLFECAVERSESVKNN